MKIFNYELKVKFNTTNNWFDFKLRKYNMYKHLIFLKLSIIFGQPHLEEIPICSLCESLEIGEVFSGDEGLTVCQSCGAVEQGYKYITVEYAEKVGIL